MKRRLPSRIIPRKVMHRHAPGTAPGTLKAVEGAPEPRLHLFAYNNDEVIESEPETPDALPPEGQDKILWLDIDGLGRVDTIEEVGKHFNIHPLALEDVFNTEHRPKTENFENYLFSIVRMARMKEGEKGQPPRLEMEQVSVFFSSDYVVTLQEKPGDCFDPVRDRLRRGQGRRIRTARADYLAYALIDAVVDNYFPVLESYSDRLEALEDEILAEPSKALMDEIHIIKRELTLMRQAIWPMRETVAQIMNNDSFVDQDNQPYLRDCYDHVIQVVDMLETYKERASSLFDLYLSSLSNKMNEIMKVLTIMSTVFIPLGFLTGLYGMNFNTDHPANMPELSWPFGYLYFWTLAFCLVGGLLGFLIHKGWIFEGLFKKRK